MKTIEQIQREQFEWSRRNFGDKPSWQPLMGVVEELGELAHAHLKQHQGIRTNEDHTLNARDAIGDIVIYLMDYCNLHGWDLETITDEVWEKVSKRDWKKNAEDGEGSNKVNQKADNDQEVSADNDRKVSEAKSKFKLSKAEVEFVRGFLDRISKGNFQDFAEKYITEKIQK